MGILHTMGIQCPSIYRYKWLVVVKFVGINNLVNGCKVGLFRPLTLTTEFDHRILWICSGIPCELLENFVSFPDWGGSYVSDTYFVSYGQNTEACTGCLASVDGPVWPNFLAHQPSESENICEIQFCR